MVPARHSETNENKTVMGEIQNRDCQYLVESVIKLVTHNKSHLKLLPKAEIKITGSLEECMLQRTLTWQNNLKFILRPCRLTK